MDMRQRAGNKANFLCVGETSEPSEDLLALGNDSWRLLYAKGMKGIET